MSVNENHSPADLETEITEMLERLKFAPITITRSGGSSYYDWKCLNLKMHGAGFTFAEVLEEALNQTMGLLWALEAEELSPAEIPESVRANMPTWNLEFLQRRYDRKQQERREVQGGSLVLSREGVGGSLV